MPPKAQLFCLVESLSVSAQHPSCFCLVAVVAGRRVWLGGGWSQFIISLLWGVKDCHSLPGCFASEAEIPPWLKECLSWEGMFANTHSQILTQGKQKPTSYMARGWRTSEWQSWLLLKTDDINHLVFIKVEKHTFYKNDHFCYFSRYMKSI